MVAQNWNKISNKVEHCQKKLVESSEREYILYNKKYNKVRKKYHVFQNLNVNVLNDTIFILEMHGESFEPLRSTIWTRTSSFSYECDQWDLDKFQKSTKPLFTKQMMGLSSMWDIKEIRKEEKLHSNWIPRRMVYLTMIVFCKRKDKIECIRFFDFDDMSDCRSVAADVLHPLLPSIRISRFVNNM